jgi:flagellar biosynthesis/type III secretory pathway protein FliH
MSIYEFDQNEYEKVIRQDGIEEGYERGIEQGIEQGMEQGAREAKQAMYQRCLSRGMSEDEARELSDYQEKEPALQE